MSSLQNKHLAESCNTFINAPIEKQMSALKNVCQQLFHEDKPIPTNIKSKYEDDRAEITEVIECVKNYISKRPPSRDIDDPDSFSALSQLTKNTESIVLIVLKESLKDWGDKKESEYMVLSSKSLKDRSFYFGGKKRKLCLDARFIEQRTAYCLGTGFFLEDEETGLVNKIMTAAHVLYPPFLKLNLKEDIRFIKSFKIKKGNTGTAYIKVKKSNIYEPESNESLKMKLTSAGADWAKITVKPSYENFNDHLPENGVTIKDSTSYTVGSPVYCLGHGLGLALKVSYDGEIIINDMEKNPDYFECKLDLFSGNSGSPIFDASTHKAIGMLIRGESEFSLKTNECIIPSVFSNQYRGEECQRLVVNNESITPPS